MWLIIKKLVRKIKRGTYYITFKIHDACFDTREKCTIKGLRPLSIELQKLNFDGIDCTRALVFWEHYKQHEFDLLGSGWVQCGYFDNAAGFEGYRYSAISLYTDKEGIFLRGLLPTRCLKKSRQMWKAIKGEYQGIDWQKDFKSGYRWNADSWYFPLKLAKKKGGDIKVPWELGRLQHLPRLAVFYHVLSEYRRDIFIEYCNQIVDFFSQNPVRWGVQSMCSMDMGIRVANIVLSYSLFVAQGVDFPDDIQIIVENGLYDSCNHIFHNLEKADSCANNHYLADLAGLLYGSCILPETTKTIKWQSYATAELQKEFVKQFYAEGSNKEGSSFYHRLSSEIIGWSLALMLNRGLVKDFDTQRLSGARQFLCSLTRPDGLMTAIGDNDSGLFFRISLTGSMQQEQPNNVSATISMLNAFFQNTQSLTGYELEYSIVKMMISNSRETNNWQLYPVANYNKMEAVSVDCLYYKHSWIVKADSRNLLDDLETIAFPSFGVYIFKSKQIYLCMILTDNGQIGNGGHAHNDKLSFELFIDGVAVYEDPGTYVYTASEELRNLYRSVKAHNTIDTGIEQNRWYNMFSIANETRCVLHEFTKNGIKAEVRYRDRIHIREISLFSDRIEISDFCNKEFFYGQNDVKVSRGYGMREYINRE